MTARKSANTAGPVAQVAAAEAAKSGRTANDSENMTPADFGSRKGTFAPPTEMKISMPQHSISEAVTLTVVQR